MSGAVPGAVHKCRGGPARGQPRAAVPQPPRRAAAAAFAPAPRVAAAAAAFATAAILTAAQLRVAQRGQSSAPGSAQLRAAPCVGARGGAAHSFGRLGGGA